MAERVVVLTEEPLGAGDVARLAALHEGEDLAWTVLVPTDTHRSVLADLLDHLSLGELRAALDTVRGSRHAEHPEPGETLVRSLQSMHEAGLHAVGTTTGQDPLPALREAVADGEQPAREVVVVTRMHAVEDTFHRDWASRARAELGVPVLHVYAGTARVV
ncbi:hypothetical protein NUM3379_05720 [Kineococcus sp. NUM-3379]